MLELHKFVKQFGARDASPYCLRLMAYMKLAKIEHTTHETMDPRTAPKAKMPYIKDGDMTMGDSELIIEYLKEKHGDMLNDGMSDADRAVAHAITIMLTERFYWAAILYPRWVLTDHHPLMVETWFGMIPGILRGFITKKIFKDVKKAAEAQGIGRHSTDDIYKMGMRDVKAVETLLGDKNFMFGDQVREVDATVYAFLSSAVTKPFVTPVSDYIESRPKLMDYIKRVDDLAFV